MASFILVCVYVCVQEREREREREREIDWLMFYSYKGHGPSWRGAHTFSYKAIKKKEQKGLVLHHVSDNY